MMKRLVMSATYRQSSRVAPEKLAKDPDNRLLSRGPRYRLDAETLRDQALFVGGLLVEHVGGPSVKPPQPVGAVGGRRLHGEQHGPIRGRHGRREGRSPQPLHLLEADLGPAADDHLRRPVARGLHGAPRADQHAAPGPAPDERAADDRGLAALAERVLREAAALCTGGAADACDRSDRDRLTGCSGWPPAAAPTPASSPSSRRPCDDFRAHYRGRPTTPGS